MKIGIIGNYGAANVGDEAILNAILKNLSGHEVTVFSAQPKTQDASSKIQIAPLFPLGFRSLLKHGLKHSKKALKELDLVLLGGGGLFQDNRLYACFLWAWQVWWVRRLQKPLIIFGTGVGPLKTRWGKRLTHWVYRQAQWVTVRDQSSYHLLKEIGVQSDIQVGADPVFSFLEAKEQMPSRKKGRIAISLRPWLQHDQNTLDVFQKFLKHLQKKYQASFVFVSMQGYRESDHELIKPLSEAVGGELLTPHRFEGVVEILQNSEFCVGMRYHFMIAALIAQTPLLPISYESKTKSLFEGSWLKKYGLEVKNLNLDDLKKAFEDLSEEYDQVSQEQKLVATRLHQASQNDAKGLKAFLKTLSSSKKS